MAVLVTNNATSELASGITAVATSLSVTATEGALFPNPTGGDVFYATLVDNSNNIEIIQVTARSGDTFTIVRGQDGTSANAYSAGDKVELRYVAAVFESKFDKSGGTITGAVTMQDDLTVEGDLAVDGNTILGDSDADTVTFNADQIYSPNDMDIETGSWNFKGGVTKNGVDLVNDTELDAAVAAAVAGIAEIPPGTIAFYGGTSIPSGWLKCDGAEVSRTTYADLFAAISTNYGIGDGSTTFDLPDGGDRVFMGADVDGDVGNTGGSNGGNISIPLKDHEHMSMLYGSLSTPSTNTTQASPTNKFVYHSGNVGSRDNEETRMAGSSTGTPTLGQTTTEGDGASPTIYVDRRQPYVVGYAIIKT